MSIQVVIYDYVDDAGDNFISAWMSGIGARARAAINTKLEHILAQTPQLEWHKTKVAAKRKGEADLWEVKVFSDNIQWRPLGFFGPEEGTFTILVGAIERNGRLDPLTAPATAQERKAYVRRNPRSHRRIHDYK